MQNKQTGERLQQRGQHLSTAQLALLFAGIIMLAVNLRPALTSVGPLIPLIREDISLTRGTAGLITTLSLLTFAAVSPVAPKIGSKIGHQRALMVGVIVLIAGIVMRYVPEAVFLFAGSLLVGAGIAMLNVLLPGVIKESFPHNIGVMTSIYTTTMVLMAAVGSGVSVPLASSAGLGWQWSLLFWVVPAIAAVLCWGFVLKNRQLQMPGRVRAVERSKSEGSIWKSPLAWQVTLFMGLQSIGFYVTITWLPDILNNLGNMPLAAAGWLVALMQIASLPATFLTPILAGRFRNQQGIIAVIGVVAVLGLGLLMTNTSPFMLTVAVLFIGLAQGGSISLALALLSIRASTPQRAADLSGMAQSVGYFMAALGPILVGASFDAWETWMPALLILMIVSVLQVGAGMGAGRNKEV
ncbi:MFS transporter, CP family, cyanate transporter [Marinococcus luteus]|uniref:MFS transporter, CP family, cyanate transporter n=1 Tax=Marinococcus luteus TaxID=1122204 RepID=A0A1H2UG52_9BACI|nr:MFS transporter [Marinococcus luteus]SDW55067.1 MFS transporter, CP family, cyanate transporter [Marinococcus luteus]